MAEERPLPGPVKLRDSDNEACILPAAVHAVDDVLRAVGLVIRRSSVEEKHHAVKVVQVLDENAARARSDGLRQGQPNGQLFEYTGSGNTGFVVFESTPHATLVISELTNKGQLKKTKTRAAPTMTGPARTCKLENLPEFQIGKLFYTHGAFVHPLTSESGKLQVDPRGYIGALIGFIIWVEWDVDDPAVYLGGEARYPEIDGYRVDAVFANAFAASTEVSCFECASSVMFHSHVPFSCSILMFHSHVLFSCVPLADARCVEELWRHLSFY